MANIDLRRETRSSDPTDPRDGEAGNVVGNDGNATRDVAEAVTLAEAARLVGKSVQALRARVKRGTLPTVEIERDGRPVTAIPRDALLREYPPVQGGSEPVAPTQKVANQDTETPTGLGDGGEPSSEVVSVVEVGIEELSDLRAAAARVTDLEARATGAEGRESKAVKRAEVEHGERQLILSRLLDADSRVLQLEEGGMPTAKADRRIVYTVAVVALLGLCALGWRLHVTDGLAVTTAGERDAATHRASVAEGSVETLRETLRDERDRASTLERDLADSEKTIETGERAARAMGEVLVQMIKGE